MMSSGSSRPKPLSDKSYRSFVEFKTRSETPSEKDLEDIIPGYTRLPKLAVFKNFAKKMKISKDQVLDII